ncbi:hypothetical protein [Erwinia amylovora]|nr:hypothetical protein [Erwinia amylovora]
MKSIFINPSLTSCPLSPIYAGLYAAMIKKPHPSQIKPFLLCTSLIKKQSPAMENLINVVAEKDAELIGVIRYLW